MPRINGGNYIKFQFTLNNPGFRNSTGTTHSGVSNLDRTEVICKPVMASQQPQSGALTGPRQAGCCWKGQPGRSGDDSTHGDWFGILFTILDRMKKTGRSCLNK